MSDPLTLTIIAIVVLLAFSGFFSGSETALTGASRPRMHQLASDGNRRAGVVSLLHAQQERLIGGILIGNNIVNILASALATSVMIQLFGDAGVAYATAGMTVLVVIFSEVLPKTYAIRHADDMALTVAPVIRVVVVLLSPLTKMVEIVVGAILRLMGEKINSAADQAREEELRGAIRLHSDTNTVAAHEGLMLGGVMDLDDVEVGEIMTHRMDVNMVDASLSPGEIVTQVLDCPHTRVPLFSGDPDNIIGVLHAKALLREVQNHDGHIDEMHISAVATEPWFIPESTDCLSQLHEFRDRREHFALVVDEYGSLQGVVTLEDIIEEIVGEIDDEHDIPVPGVRRQSDGSFLVDGRVTVRDLNREFDWGLSDDEASTIAGLVLHEARFIPEEGQSFAIGDLKVDVLRRSGNQLRQLRIKSRTSHPEPEPPAPPAA
ncbi:MAG: HlyC/CorC family transporter [Alphaproteobacteria bacterium]|nr:HlyC/CorC family transporter [Alphaproteobacteria bacterium]